MAQPPEDKRPDFSSLPRGAIGIKGFPVSRNTRLPSIRGPRDLTLVTLPKKTYMPNIPVRREKKLPVSESSSQQKQDNAKFEQRKSGQQSSDRGRGRGRGKGQIIQTTGAIFSEGIAQDPSMRKEKGREAYQKSDCSSSKGISVKKEKDCDIGDVNRKMDDLLRDDFIDDGDDDDIIVMKPTIFPATAEIKREIKIQSTEPAEEFDPNTAKEVGFDVNQVAKFIKKEKDVEIEEKKTTTSTETVLSSDTPKNEIKDLLLADTNSSSKLVLLQFPEFVSQKIEDSDSHRQTNSDPKVPDNQTPKCASIKSLPEGCIGKLKIKKSGKAKLIIGSIELNVDTIDIFKSRHELVCIRTDSNFGDLDTLGYVDHKVKFVPDEDSLIA